MARLLAVDLDAPVLVVVAPVLRVGAQAPRPGHALGLDAIVADARLQDHNNYAGSLIDLQKYEEAMSLLRKTMPVARRVTGDTSDISIRMRKIYADALYEDPGATLVDLREAVTTLEDTARIARRVFGGAHPLTRQTEQALQQARAALRAREASA